MDYQSFKFDFVQIREFTKLNDMELVKKASQYFPGRKLLQVKLVRDIRGCGLAEAKAIVDQYYVHIDKQQYWILTSLNETMIYKGTEKEAIEYTDHCLTDWGRVRRYACSIGGEGVLFNTETTTRII